MITDEFIKSEFISSILKRDIGIIYKTQAQVVREQLSSHTGVLSQYVTRGKFTLQAGSGVQTLFVPVLPYLRMLDIHYRREYMNQRRKLALYNRVIWGTLYNETLPDLKYGLTADIRRQMRKDLEDNGGASSKELHNKWINNLLK